MRDRGKGTNVFVCVHLGFQERNRAGIGCTVLTGWRRWRFSKPHPEALLSSLRMLTG